MNRRCVHWSNGSSRPDPDTSEQVTETKEWVSGAKDQQTRTTLLAALKRRRECINRLRPKGGRTAAVAVYQQAEQMMALEPLTGKGDAGKGDAGRFLSLAEEAHRLAPSAGTSSLLTAAYLHSAAEDLCRTDPAFDAFHKKIRPLARHVVFNRGRRQRTGPASAEGHWAPRCAESHGKLAR